MTAGIVIGIATVAGILVLAFGRRSRMGDALGLVALLATTVLATTITDQDLLILGDDALVGSLYLRLYLVLGGAAATVLVLIGFAVGSPSSVAGVALLALAGAGMALAVTDPMIAILASTAAAVAAAMIVADRRSGPRVAVAARALRSMVLAGLLAFGGVVWLATAGGVAPIPGEGVDGALSEGVWAGVVGLAFLAVALALAIRLGAIPFHGWAARIAEATPPSGLPATLALGPGAFAVVVIAWLDGSVGTLGEPLLLERWIVLAVGAASLVFGAIAAWLHDDIEHMVAYSLVQDAGVILLAVAALDPAAWEAVRLWVLSVIVVKSALAAWAAAARHAFGTRRVPELGGWARRSPLLTIAFIIVLVAAVGLPGLAAFDARADLIGLVADGPIAALLLLAALAPVGYLGRILAVGFGPPSSFVAAAGGSGLVWPSAEGRPSGAEAPAADRRRIDPLLVARTLPAAWRANRVPVAATLALALAGLAMATSAGGFGAISAAAEPAPGSGASGPIVGPGEPGSSAMPDDGSGETAAPPDPSPSPSAAGAASEAPPESPAGSPTEPEPSSAEPGANPPPSFEPVPTP